MDKFINEAVSVEGVLRAYAELAADMDKISYAAIRFYNPETAGPYWVDIDFKTKEWTLCSHQEGAAEKRDTLVVGTFERFYDLRDLLYMFSDSYAHERLKALGRIVYGRRSFT